MHDAEKESAERNYDQQRGSEELEAAWRRALRGR
jgi:hypothetical protein